MYCNDYMLEQGPDTMMKYALGKGSDTSHAKDTAMPLFLDSFTYRVKIYIVMM